MRNYASGVQPMKNHKRPSKAVVQKPEHKGKQWKRHDNKRSYNDIA